MKNVAVIMAGGKGERFWPKSRNSKPKQFLSLTNDRETMIQKTVNRLNGFIYPEDIFIVTNSTYALLVKEQLKSIPEENILTEPIARDTAPCIGLAATVIKKRYGDAVMIVLPSDHLIKFNQMFIDTLISAAEVAEKDSGLVTIGITPTYPETGYGYINFESRPGAGSGVYNVKRFVEKPNTELAKEYFDSGEYLWNSGMFVWKVSTILDNINKYLPDMTDGLNRILDSCGTERYEETLKTAFMSFKSESIDFGVMEKASGVYTIPGNFGWDDVGNWLALDRINRTNEYGNMINGDVITINTKNTTVSGNRKLIALVGIEDIIVVDTDDALLICAKDSTQDVKKVIENLKICNRSELI